MYLLERGMVRGEVVGAAMWVLRSLQVAVLEESWVQGLCASTVWKKVSVWEVAPGMSSRQRAIAVVEEE
jgi:hypothetical protein